MASDTVVSRARLSAARQAVHSRPPTGAGWPQIEQVCRTFLSAIDTDALDGTSASPL